METGSPPPSPPPPPGPGGGTPPPPAASQRTRGHAASEGLLIGIALAVLYWFVPQDPPGPDLPQLHERMAALYGDPTQGDGLAERPALDGQVEEVEPDPVLAQLAADTFRRRGAPHDSLTRTRISRGLRHLGHAATEMPLYLQAISVRCERGHPVADAVAPLACSQDGGQPAGPGRFSTLLFTAPAVDGTPRVIEAAVEVPLPSPGAGGEGRLPTELYDVRDLTGDPRPEVVLLDRRKGARTLRVLSPAASGRWVNLTEQWTPPRRDPPDATSRP
ncbi:hypothetical protein L6R50_18585 [Myxococcota bacterium]|nr:hypothetical protein [Myxococcota bacterium]